MHYHSIVEADVESEVSRERALTVMIAGVFVISGVIGGGPTLPALSMVCELAACLLCALALIGIVDGDYASEARAALVLLALICFAPLLQLVPIPEVYWRGLPGHSLPDAILRLAGVGLTPRPLSLDPQRTRLALIALAVPASIFLSTLQLSARDRQTVFTVFLSFALLSSLLGVFQVAAGGGVELGIYPQIHNGYPIGFFANRNHEADLLLCAMPIGTYLIMERALPRHVKMYIAAALNIFFIASVLSTQSRTAFALLPLATAGSIFQWTNDYSARKRWIAIASLAVVTFGIGALISLTPIGHRIMHRFSDSGDDLRLQMWQTTSLAARAYWPMGSGIGTFVPVYQMFENLNSVGIETVNHAHNDYLEIYLETGILGIALIVGYFLVATNAALRSSAGQHRRQREAGIFIILILLAHSLVDYPLRTFGLAAVFAFSNALLFRARPDARKISSPRRSRKPRAGSGPKLRANSS